MGRSVRGKSPVAKGRKPRSKEAAAKTRARSGNSSDTSKGAKATKRKPARPAKPRAARAKAPASPPPAPPPERPSRGRPKDTADVWTPERIAEVADSLWSYVEATPCPLLAEFCYLNGIRRQRIYEFPELVEVKNFLQEKRAMYFDLAGRTLSREDGPRGAFIIRALANVGAASMVEKTETLERVQSVNVYLPDNSRGDGPKAEPRA